MTLLYFVPQTAALDRCASRAGCLASLLVLPPAELFHTERTHVRNLKVLVHLFNRPMVALNILQPNDINLLFGGCCWRLLARWQSVVYQWLSRQRRAELISRACTCFLCGSCFASFV